MTHCLTCRCWGTGWRCGTSQVACTGEGEGGAEGGGRLGGGGWIRVAVGGVGDGTVPGEGGGQEGLL